MESMVMHNTILIETNPGLTGEMPSLMAEKIGQFFAAGF